MVYKKVLDNYFKWCKYLRIRMAWNRLCNLQTIKKSLLHLAISRGATVPFPLLKLSFSSFLILFQFWCNYPGEEALFNIVVLSYLGGGCQCPFSPGMYLLHIPQCMLLPLSCLVAFLMSWLFFSLCFSESAWIETFGFICWPYIDFIVWIEFNVICRWRRS